MADFGFHRGGARPPPFRLPLSGGLPYKRTRRGGRSPAQAPMTAGAVSQMPKTIYVLNGPNLNLLGGREPEIYGRATLADVEKLCRTTAERHGLAVEFRQSNHEGEIVDWVQQARAEKAVGLIINPAGYTTTSIAILDALLTMEAPVIEVHITNIHRREQFRRRSYISQAARAVICGCGVDGYALAITGIAAMIGAKD
jgi:3-dehydroquinate dehydratase II